MDNIEDSSFNYHRSLVLVRQHAIHPPFLDQIDGIEDNLNDYPNYGNDNCTAMKLKSTARDNDVEEKTDAISDDSIYASIQCLVECLDDDYNDEQQQSDDIDQDRCLSRITKAEDSMSLLLVLVLSDEGGCIDHGCAAFYA
jgi:hypothetical protein